MSRAPRIGILVACMASGVGVYACAAKSGAVSVSTDEIAALPDPVTTGRFALGINEAIAVPSKQRSKLSMNDLDSRLAADAAKVRALGATFVRAHTGSFPMVSCYSLKRSPSNIYDLDAWVRALGTDLEGVAMVSPWPGNQTGAYTSTYLPDDMDDYRECVQAIVERYDGDGEDDMPKLPKPVIYWEIDNEPDLKNTNVARGAADYDPAKFALPSEYASVLLATSKAIRKANPKAKILAGGLYRPHATNGQNYLQGILENSKVPEAFDILSLHTYADDDGERLSTGIAASRMLLPDKPVWVTETSVSANDGDDVQARRVAALVAQAAAAGAERMFWHTLADPKGASGKSSFSTNSLMTATSETTAEDKPAAKTFRYLAQQLAKDNLVGAVANGSGAVKLKSGAILLYSGSREATHGGVNLSTGLSINAGTTASAPAWLYGN